MADWGMKVSQDGFDVKTCEDKDLVMSSKLNLLKSKMVGTVTGSGNVAHGLSYIPIFFTTELVGGKWGVIGDDAYTKCDTTNLVVTSTGTVKYYIFYQEGIT